MGDDCQYQSGGPNKGSRTIFRRRFRRKTFTVDEHFSQQIKREKAVWLDWGKDNYASVSLIMFHRKNGLLSVG